MLSRNGWVSVTSELLESTRVDGVLCSAINAHPDAFASYLARAKALCPSEPVVGCSLVPLGFPGTYSFF